MPARDLKPLLAQKFIGDAFYKLQEQVEQEKQTRKAFKSVHDIKGHQLKTQAKQTKQKIALAEQTSQQFEEKMKSQDLMLCCLDEERWQNKKKQTFDIAGRSPSSPALDPSLSPDQAQRKFNASMKPPVPGRKMPNPGDFAE